MFREVIYFCAELLNYWSMTFWGLKLFAKVYDIHVNENKVVENVLFALMCLPIAWNAAGNYVYVVYSSFLNYILVIYMYMLLIILRKNIKKIALSLVAFYIFGIRLVDLWIVTVITEISKISRELEIDLIHVGIDRIIFIIFLAFIYYWIYKMFYKTGFVFYLRDNRVYSILVCIYSIVGTGCFSTVYKLGYSEILIKYWIFYLICAFALFGVFLIYFVKNRIQEKERLLTMRNDMMESNYKGLKIAYEVNQTLQHDYKNHLLAVSELIKELKNQEALDYIYTYISYEKESSIYVKSGNDIVDIIVNCKIKEAKEKNIKFTYEIEFLNNIIIDDVDMCALLANLLDNAIEACEKLTEDKAKIYLKVIKRNEMLIIHMVNSIHKDMLNKKYFFKSEKENSQLHGWGMHSIEQVINKYGGIKEHYIENEYFEMFITIPI